MYSVFYKRQRDVLRVLTQSMIFMDYILFNQEMLQNIKLICAYNTVDY